MSEQQPQQQTSNPSDPLASLHRMSTTAGVASQEYVAINLAAVTALVLGLASILVLFANVLLLVPIAAVLAGIFGFRQVAGSNGTQTGKALALIGILLGLGMLGFVGFREVQTRSAVAQERKLIEVVVSELEKDLKADNFDAAWDLFSPQFKAGKQISKEQFAQLWGKFSHLPVYGSVDSMRLNDRLQLESSGKDQFAKSILLVRFTKAEQLAYREVHFRKTGGQWLVEDVPAIFPSTPDAGQGGPAPTVPQF